MSSGATATQIYLAAVVGGNGAPVFSSDSYTFTIFENVIDAQVIGRLMVTDNEGTYSNYFRNHSQFSDFM